MTKRPPSPLIVKELERIKVLRANGLSFHAISKEVGRDPKTVKKACLQPQTANEIQAIKQELADMYEGLAKRMITSITDEDIQKINAYQRTLSSAVSVDKMRLLREQSTENVSLHAIVERIDREEREGLGKEGAVTKEIAQIES